MANKYSLNIHSWYITIKFQNSQGKKKIELAFKGRNQNNSLVNSNSGSSETRNQVS